MAKTFCGARRQMSYNGHPFTAKCTRFWGHANHPSGKYKDHFDQMRKIRWSSRPHPDDLDKSGR